MKTDTVLDTLIHLIFKVIEVLISLKIVLGNALRSCQTQMTELTPFHSHDLALFQLIDSIYVDQRARGIVY